MKSQKFFKKNKRNLILFITILSIFILLFFYKSLDVANDLEVSTSGNVKVDCIKFEEDKFRCGINVRQNPEFTNSIIKPNYKYICTKDSKNTMYWKDTQACCDGYTGSNCETTVSSFIYCSDQLSCSNINNSDIKISSLSNYKCSGGKITCAKLDFNIPYNINLRRDPGTNSEVLEVVPKGTKISIVTDPISLNKIEIKDGDIWIPVIHGNALKGGFMSVKAINGELPPSSGGSGSPGVTQPPVTNTPPQNNPTNTPIGGGGGSSEPTRALILTNPPFNTTKNTCGAECSWSKGLCAEGFTCMFYNQSCFTPPFGLPSQESVCVPNDTTNVSSVKCNTSFSTTDNRILKLDGTSWTPTSENIDQMCGTTSPTTKPTVLPTGAGQDSCGPLDVNGNGRIDIFDFSVFLRKYNQTCQ